MQNLNSGLETEFRAQTIRAEHLRREATEHRRAFQDRLRDLI